MQKRNWLLLITLVLSLGVNSCMSEHNRFGIDPIAWGKFDPNLRRAIVSLQADPTVDLPVMIALTVSTEPPAAAPERRPSREERARLAAERQTAFERKVADLVQELEPNGVDNIQLFWINQTVSGRMALPALEAVGRRQEVRQIVLSVRQIALH